MNLFILRHGKAINSAVGMKDFDRKLSEEGILQAIKIGDYLKDKGINQIICSSAPRALETATIIDELIKVEHFNEDKHLYLVDSETIQHKIIENGQENNLLYVGHNFGISDFVSDLSGQNLSLSTCMLVEFEMQIDNWKLLSAETGIIKTITEPNQL